MQDEWHCGHILVKLEEKEESQLKGEIEMADFKTVDIPVTKEKVKTDMNRGLIVDEKNNIICKKDKTITHISICKDCEKFGGFDHVDDNFIVNCNYVEKTVKQRILEEFQNAPDYHPAHLSDLVDRIMLIMKEDK